MESMTGYSFIEQKSDRCSFSVEIKSLNSRYSEFFVNVPRLLKNEEYELENILKNSFSRGKVELNIDIFEWNDAAPAYINREAVIRYYKELASVRKELKLTEPLPLESVLRLDGVTVRTKSGLTDTLKKDIYKAVEKAVKNTIAMRRKEGRSTGADLSAAVKVIAERIAVIRKLAAASSAAKQEQLRKRIADITGNKTDPRIFSEIALLAEKLDINEELVRLSDHIKKFRTVMKEDGQTGKKLDFIAQEMFREINTVASKTSDSGIAHNVIDVKNYIDKIREQCRNII